MLELTTSERGICNLALIKMQNFWQHIEPCPWVDAPDEEIRALIKKLAAPTDDELLLECPSCGHATYVPCADYLLNAALGGEPFVCQNEKCPAVSVLQVVDPSIFDDDETCEEVAG